MGLSHYLRLSLGYHERGEGIELEPGREGYIGAGYRHDTRLSPLTHCKGTAFRLTHWWVQGVANPALSFYTGAVVSRVSIWLSSGRATL